MQKSTITKALYWVLRDQPTIHANQTLELKVEEYVATGEDFCLERIWLQREHTTKPKVLVERRSWPNGSWKDVAEYEVTDG